MTISEAFAQRVKEILSDKKMTQYKLCQNTGLYPSTMNYIINAKAKGLNFKSMAVIIEELGLSMTEFFDSKLFDFDNLDVD